MCRQRYQLPFRVHFFKPLSKNCLNPIACLIIPNTGSTVSSRFRKSFSLSLSSAAEKGHSRAEIEGSKYRMMNKSPDFVRYLSRYQDVFQMKSDRLLD
jgi:hypothetical protein